MQGSGNSQGDWVTLGAHEVEDLAVVVAHLRETYPSATIGLWGRSMGAVTALMYSAKDPSIAGVVGPRLNSTSIDAVQHLQRLNPLLVSG